MTTKNNQSLIILNNKMDKEMKYNIAKGWISEIITKSLITDPHTSSMYQKFKGEDYSEAITMVLNDYHMKLKYETK